MSEYDRSKDPMLREAGWGVAPNPDAPTAAPGAKAGDSEAVCETCGQPRSAHKMELCRQVGQMWPSKLICPAPEQAAPGSGKVAPGEKLKPGDPIPEEVFDRVTPLPTKIISESTPGGPSLADCQRRGAISIMEAGVREITPGDLVMRALRNLPNRCSDRRERWSAVSWAFGLGSTYSQELCMNFGFDPYEKIGKDPQIEEDEECSGCGHSTHEGNCGMLGCHCVSVRLSSNEGEKQEVPSIASYTAAFVGSENCWSVWRKSEKVCGGFESHADAALWIEKLRLSQGGKS